MIKSITSLTFFFLLFPTFSFAQVNMWGSGLYGGTQGCSTPVRASTGANSINDTTKEILAEIREAQKQLITKKSEKRKADRNKERARNAIEKSISSDYAEFILEHIENSRHCSEYKNFDGSTEYLAQGSEEDAPIKPSTSRDRSGPPPEQLRQGSNANSNMLPVSGFSLSQWQQYCERRKAGTVRTAVCSNPLFSESGSGRRDSGVCKNGITDFQKESAKSEKLQIEIEGLEDRIALAKEDLQDARSESQEMQSESRFSQTEADFCPTCIANQNNETSPRSQTDWASVAANIGTGLAAAYFGQKQTETIAKYNANAGFPTQSYPALSYGYPYIQAGLYGAISGGTGQGSFGCGNGINGTGGINSTMGGLYASMGNQAAVGSVFGYPSNIVGNTMSGGLYISGMGPTGLNNYGNMMGSYGGLYGNYGNMMGNYGGLYGNYGNMMGNYGSLYGNNMTYNSSALAYQQQVMQLQMQQYQTQLQYSQQYQQQMLQKYQTASSLQQEISTLMNRLQQVQYGTSSYLSGTLGTSAYSAYPTSYSTYPTIYSNYPSSTSGLVPILNTQSSR